MIHVNYSLRRVKLNSNGYDSQSGYVFSTDKPVYCCRFRADGSTDVLTAHMHASTRLEAMHLIKGGIARVYNTTPDQICLWRGNV